MSTPLTLSLALDHTAMPAGDSGQLTLVARVNAGERPEASVRPALLVVFSLDVSGSMRGDPLDQVVDSVGRLIELLGADDKAGVVAFANEAYEIVPVAPLVPEHKGLIRDRIAELEAQGATHIEAGLRAAHDALPPLREGERQVVLLLSDGAPNRGITTSTGLADVAATFRAEASVSTLGYGPRHVEDLLEAVAHAGGGRYRYISDPLVCRGDLAYTLGSQGDVVAEGLELELRPADGVEIGRVMGRPRTRFGRQGLIVSLPDLVSEDRQLAIASLTVDAPREGSAFQVAEALLRYRASGSRQLCTTRKSVSIRLSDSGWGEPTPQVTREILAVRADEARVEARGLAERGQQAAGAALLREIIREIGEIGEVGPIDDVNAEEAALSELREQLIDEADVLEQEPDEELYRASKRASMTYYPGHQTRTGLATKTLGSWGRSVVASASGPVPDAYLLVLQGPSPGRRLPLAAQQVLGRTEAADLCIAHNSVSRHHASIVVRDGQFMVLDMGSSNGSQVNGATLRHGTPYQLADGDELSLGSAVLRFCLGDGS